MSTRKKMSGAEKAQEVRRAAALLGGDEEENRRTIASTVGVTPEFVHGVLGPLPEPIPPRPMPELHQSCQFIPPAGPDVVKELTDDIQENGLKEPLILDLDGRLVDGRARWEACRAAGVRPVFKKIRSNAWEYSVSANAARFPNPMERLIIAAKLPVRGGGIAVRNDPRPPTAEFMCKEWGLTWGSLKPMRSIARAGASVEIIFDALRQGFMKPGTARRIAMNAPEEQWPELIERVRLAAKGGPAAELPVYAYEKGKKGDQPVLVGGNNRSNSERSRQSFITAAQLRQAIDALAAFSMVAETAKGVDPAIDADLAAILYRDLATARRPLNQVVIELKRRKESTP